MPEAGKQRTTLRTDSLVFGIAVGLLVAGLAYRWVTGPAEDGERLAEEAAVVAARTILAERLELAGLAIVDLTIVDPLAPRRQVGKSYVYPTSDGWEVSGWYRRDDADDWHAWLMQLDRELALVRLKVRDDHARLRQRGERDVLLDVVEAP